MPPTPSEQVDALSQNLDDMSGLVDQLVKVITDGDAIAADLRRQVADLIAAANINAAEKAALTAKVDAAFTKSEDVENKMRAAVPIVPPVGGRPLASSYASRAEFDAAVQAYDGPESVTLDGSEQRTGTTPAIDYFSHSGDGSISLSGPTD